MHCAVLRSERKWIFFFIKLNSFRSRHLIWLLHFCVKVLLFLMQWAFSPDGCYLQTLPHHKWLFQEGQGPLCSTCSQCSCEWHLCLHPASGKNHTCKRSFNCSTNHISILHIIICVKEALVRMKPGKLKMTKFPCFLVNNQNVLCSSVYLLASTLHILFIFLFISK